MPKIRRENLDVFAETAPAILTIPEAAAAIRASRATINRMIAAGRIEAIRLPGGTRVKRDSIRALIANAEPVKYRARQS